MGPPDSTAYVQADTLSNEERIEANANLDRRWNDARRHACVRSIRSGGRVLSVNGTLDQDLADMGVVDGSGISDAIVVSWPVSV